MTKETILYQDKHCTVRRHEAPGDGTFFESIYVLVNNPDPSSPIETLSVSISRANPDGGSKPTTDTKDCTFELYAGLKPDHTEKSKWQTLRAMFPDPMPCVYKDKYPFFIVYDQNSHSDLKKPDALAHVETYNEALDIMGAQRLITSEAKKILEHVIPMMLGSPDLINTGEGTGRVNMLLDISADAACAAVNESMKQFYARSPA
jgi:hypothetical protein